MQRQSAETERAQNLPLPQSMPAAPNEAQPEVVTISSQVIAPGDFPM